MSPMWRARLMSVAFVVASFVCLPKSAHAEGSTSTSEKVGACALHTAVDARQFSSVPMEVEVGAPGKMAPGRRLARSVVGRL